MSNLKKAAAQLRPRQALPIDMRTTILLALLAFGGASTPTEASSIRSRRMHAIVQTVDLQARSLVVEPSDSHKPTAFALSRHTWFLRDWKFAPKNELREGAQVTIYYRTPFFGKPLVTRVLWSTPRM